MAMLIQRLPTMLPPSKMIIALHSSAHRKTGLELRDLRRRTMQVYKSKHNGEHRV